MPPREQGASRQRLSADGAKLGYWLAGSRDRYLLALGNPIDHLAAMVPQFADRDFSHLKFVSRVRQTAHAGSRGASALTSPPSRSGGIHARLSGRVSLGYFNRPREAVTSTISACWGASYAMSRPSGPPLRTRSPKWRPRPRRT